MDYIKRSYPVDKAYDCMLNDLWDYLLIQQLNGVITPSQADELLWSFDKWLHKKMDKYCLINLEENSDE